MSDVAVQDRRALLEELETALGRFVLRAIPQLTPPSLGVFDAAAKASFQDLTPTEFATRLAHQSKAAAEQCLKYEREYGVYDLAEALPQSEAKLEALRNLLSATQRSLHRLSLQLAPVDWLNFQLRHKGCDPLTRATLASYQRPASLWAHLRRWVRDYAYRQVSPVLAQLGDIEGLWAQEDALRQTEMVRQQEYDVQQQTVSEQRMWVTAYAETNSERLTTAQMVQAVRQLVIDQLHDPLYRGHVAAAFDRRWPTEIDKLFDKLATLAPEPVAALSPREALQKALAA